MNELRRSRRKQKLERVLKKICDQVNTIPRGYGSLPENKNISLNGYFNYKHPRSQSLENTTAGIMDTGNDHETNVRLYASEIQLIDDLLYENRIEIRAICQKHPELWVKVNEMVSDLKERAAYEDILREKGYQEEIAGKARILDEKYNALAPDFQYKEIAQAGISGVLNRAEKKFSKEIDEEWGEFLGAKKKKQLSETMEKLKVYLMRENLSLVPHKEIMQYRKTDCFFESRGKQEAKINDVFKRAEKEWGEPLNAKEKKQLSATMKKLKVYLINKEDLQLVPRDEIMNYRTNDPNTRPFKERLLQFTKKHEPTQDGNHLYTDLVLSVMKEIKEHDAAQDGHRAAPEAQEVQEAQKASPKDVDAYTRAVAVEKQKRKVTGAKKILAPLPQRGRSGR
ncbi:MAG: hypothetical protein PHS83_04935 [Clostridia bacterium]|nr:hypothetical protein [Clostridia bacterium]